MPEYLVPTAAQECNPDPHFCCCLSRPSVPGGDEISTTAGVIEWYPSSDLLGPPLLEGSLYGEPTAPIPNDIGSARSFSGRSIPQPTPFGSQAFEDCDLNFGLKQQPPLGHFHDDYISVFTAFNLNNTTISPTSFDTSQESLALVCQHTDHGWRDFNECTPIESLGTIFNSPAVLDSFSEPGLGTNSHSDLDTTSTSSDQLASSGLTFYATTAHVEQPRLRVGPGGPYKCDEPGCKSDRLWATRTKLRLVLF